MLAIPSHRDSNAYRRLRHLWIDPTRTRTKERIQEFYHSGWETHISAALWENFAVLPTSAWLPLLAFDAGLWEKCPTISAVNWSYGWVAKPQIMDVVVHYRLTTGDEGVIVIEAKTPWSKALEGKDLLPEHYLSHPRLRHFVDKAIVYLVDESLREKTRTSVDFDPRNVGLLTWQQLADIQISACAHIDAPIEIQTFVASAIRRQFAEFGIVSSKSAAGYLTAEPSRSDVDAIPNAERQDSADRERELWRLESIGSV